MILKDEFGGNVILTLDGEEAVKLGVELQAAGDKALFASGRVHED